MPMPPVLTGAIGLRQVGYPASTQCGPNAVLIQPLLVVLVVLHGVDADTIMGGSGLETEGLAMAAWDMARTIKAVRGVRLHQNGASRVRVMIKELA